MPQAGALISAVFPRLFDRFVKAVLLRCNMWHIGVRKDSFRIAVCRLLRGDACRRRVAVPLGSIAGRLRCRFFMLRVLFLMPT